jgi:serine/threonine-protein kinase
LAADAALSILIDMATALADLDGQLVHRDIKPANVLRLDDRWCLADFGISRYADASTAPDTQKYAWTAAYAAPEQWRTEHASAATDIYALGAVAVELLTGKPPFPGLDAASYREQHLHDAPPALAGIPDRLATLIHHCLMKAPGARPDAAEVLRRLETINTSIAPAAGSGAGRLAAVAAEHARRKGEVARAASAEETERRRREELAKAAQGQLSAIATELLTAVSDQAGAPAPSSPVRGPWRLGLGGAELTISPAQVVARHHGSFDVVVESRIVLIRQPDRNGYRGRSHSLYFCDAQQAGSTDGSRPRTWTRRS